ncbi:MAG: HAMP domain-containing protein [Nitrospirae bacterium]|nr:HAMP domain-containing protein [Nitrospirota bacterium]
MFRNSLVNKILGLNLVILIAVFSLFIILSATGQNKNMAGIIFIALVSILSTAIIIRLALKRIVADPVRDVIQHIKDVGSGSFDKFVDVRSSDEIGELAAGFNQMTQNLSRSCQELEQWTKELESRVHDRTKELQDTQVHLIQTEKLAATGKLAAGVAHEINNPIGIILNRIECLEMEAAEKKVGKEIMNDLKVISEHAKRVSKIVGGLLAFSRQTSKDSKLEQINVNDILEKAVILFDRIALQKGVQIEKRFYNGLSPIMGDAQKLEQAMVNLIDNALDATDRGGRIIVESRKKFRNDYFVQILVSDTGCGIPKENLNKIFDPFFTTKDVRKGTGLGLAVSYGIIKEHHGKIEVKSLGGKGAAFIITIPTVAEIYKGS